MESISLYEKRDELRRVLQSRHFARAKKKSRFLEFVCQQTFLGNAEQLSEYLIGIEVYERGTDFDPQEDAIVRVQAHEIRRSLKEYYEQEGKDSPWRIDLPSGHYVPVFIRANGLEPPVSAAPDATASTTPLVTGWDSLRWRRLVLALALLCGVLGFLLIRALLDRESVPSRAARVTALENFEWFWKPFLPPAEPPLIVIPNHPLLRAAHEGDSPRTLAESHLIPKEKLPGFRDTIHFRELKGFYFVPSTTDFTAVGETMGLLNLFEHFTGFGQKVRLKASRLVDFEEIQRGNTILLGGNQSWSGRNFLYPEGFWFHAGVISNQTPLPGERPVYKPEFDPVTNSLRRDYALVLMLPNARKEHRILLIYGIYTQGSQAAIEYVTNRERMQELRKSLVQLTPDKKSPPRFFQVLLETTVENSVPGKTNFVGARIIPG